MWSFLSALLSGRDLFNLVRRHGDTNVGPAFIVFALVGSAIAVLANCEEAGVFSAGGGGATVQMHRPDPNFDVEVRSGEATLFQTATSQGCELACRVGTGIAWTRSGECLGARTDEFFLADDCVDLLAVKNGRVTRSVRGVPVSDPALASLPEARGWRREGLVISAEVDGKRVQVPLRR